ncbi:MAG: redoxin domain-containing protein [Candidatus Tectomicrobia bacterium]|uniref:Redoxin domain-containing protein n=1 Tax=Tectimicrobiota bacterium TaxID=2528274 RepID=A0A938B294_UNCTE|nr:redoxin domain-containing protein [Candidatus Tectomicrobia bacterium]
MMQRQRWQRVLGVLCLSGWVLCLAASSVQALQVGDKAPDFALPSTTAEEIKLADYVGKKSLVLFFYIGAFAKG